MSQAELDDVDLAGYGAVMEREAAQPARFLRRRAAWRLEHPRATLSDGWSRIPELDRVGLAAVVAILPGRLFGTDTKRHSHAHPDRHGSPDSAASNRHDSADSNRHPVAGYIAPAAKRISGYALFCAAPCAASRT